MARLHGSVLAAGALSVVLVAEDDPVLPVLAVGLRDVGVGVLEAGEEVDAVAELTGEGVVGTCHQVAADVGEVAAVLQPRTRCGDVVGGALAEGLHENPKTGDIVAIPGRERGQALDAV